MCATNRLEPAEPVTLQQRVHGAARPPSWHLDKLHRVLRVRRGIKNDGMKEDNLLSLSYGRIIPKDINTSEGLLPENFEGYQIVEPGNIVMRLTDLQNDKRSLRQGLVKERGIITSAYDALDVPKGQCPEFWFYSLLALDLAKHYYSLGGGVRQSVKFTDFPNDWIYRPDLTTQRQIAKFLDRETARIDLLIEKKQRMVELLGDEWESTVESSIVHPGPKSKLGHHIEILSGYAFASADFSDDSGDVRLLRGINVNPGQIRWDETVFWPVSKLKEVRRFILRPGDVVLGMDRPWISSGIRVAELGEQDAPSLLLQRVCRISPRPSLVKKYMLLLLSSRRFSAYFEPLLTGVSVPHISPDQVRSFVFDYAPVENQRVIVDQIGRVETRLRAMVQSVLLSITRLREYRSALITAAVTGQIDPSTHARAGSTDRQLDALQAEGAT